jgi:inhibitor of growth protein 3
MTRKRRRQEAFEEQTPEANPVRTEEEVAKAREEKEQEIWDAVREAHYEGQLMMLPINYEGIHHQFFSY